MTFADFTLNSKDQLPKDSQIEEILNKSFPKKNYLKLIKAAHTKGFTIEGYTERDSNKAWENLRPWREKRNHYNSSDQMYTYTILEKSKKYPIADKFLILSGEAHTNAFDESGSIETNTQLLGEFISQGISPKDLRVINLRRRYPVTSLKYNMSFEDYILPLPKGRRPGCSNLEPCSAWDILLFIDGI